MTGPHVDAFLKGQNFFNIVEKFEHGYEEISLYYVAIKSSTSEDFIIIQGRILYDALPVSDFNRFESENLKAGRILLKDIGLSPRSLFAAVLQGKISTPHGNFLFPSGGAGCEVTYFPFHDAGIQNQSRIAVLSVTAKDQAQYLRQPTTDWELRASKTPYDGLQDLFSEFRLHPTTGGVNTIEFVASGIVVVDAESRVEGTSATLALRLSKKLQTERTTLGFRVLNQGKVVERKSIAGSELFWAEKDGVLRGEIKVEVLPASVVQCFASYDNTVFHFWWIHDLQNVQNPRRVAFEAWDSGLLNLREMLLTKSLEKRNSREFELSVSWLMWLLGFSVSHLNHPKLQDGPDIIATTPQGKFVVVECTVGLLKEDSKLSLLVSRAEMTRRRLEESNNKHLSVMPVLITSKPRSEVSADLEAAQKLGVVVMTIENLTQAIERTVLLPNADQLYSEAEKALTSAEDRTLQ